ncbi:MAG: autotransporter-associated beta strand repeat-containing protein [Kiritimatiellia bacterium]
MSAALGGSGATLTKTCAGSVSLTGNNTYTGLTDVQAGTLPLNRSGGAIAITAAVQVSGGTLAVTQSDTVGAVTLASGTISGAGTLTGRVLRGAGQHGERRAGRKWRSLTKTTAGVRSASPATTPTPG